MNGRDWAFKHRLESINEPRGLLPASSVIGPHLSVVKRYVRTHSTVLPFPRSFPALRGLQLFALLGLALAGAGNVHAATLTVTTLADSGTGSLRDTIAAAGDGDTIQFDTALNGQTITLTTDELVIDKDITINGPGPDLLTVAKTPSQPPYFGIVHIMPGHTVTIEGITISRGYYGGIFNDSATLTINNCAVSSNFCDCGFGAGGITNPTGTLTIVDSVVSNNHAGYTTGNPSGYGGGIYSFGTLTIIHSTLTNNTAAIHGGGIMGGGTITITDSTISGNRAGSDILHGTGIGGGLFVGGTVEIRNSTVSGNIASGNEFGVGGGIDSSGSLTIVNSTISGNLANQDGGGIRSAADGTATLTISNSTISGNEANRNGGGIIITKGGSATLDIGNTILGNSGSNIVNEGGTVTSHGYNLSSDNGGGFLTGAGDQINTSPMLGPLQDNGGPTLTHLPQTGSPAINAGDPNFTPPPDFDQRGSGFLRVYNGRIDIGSLEVQPTPPPPTPTPTPTPLTPTPTPTATASATPTATATATATPTATSTATVPPTATPTPTPAFLVQFGNISTRLKVGTGDNVLIGGFIVTGTQSKKVILRAIGPSLPLSGTLADPVLELRNSSGGLIASNDNWRSDQEAEISATGIPPGNDLESAIVATLPANNAAYTAIVHGANNGTGIGVVEVYDLDRTVDSKLANISTRGFVQTGDDVLIGGLIVLGQNPLGVIVRAIGPSLPLPGTLGDPTLELHDGNGALIAVNDNWRSDQEAEIIATGIPPSNDLESAIVRNLAPGNYTAIVRGMNNTTGIAVVEAYALN
jgi:hypothetical protein